MYSFIAFGEWNVAWDAADEILPSDAISLSDTVNGDSLLHVAARCGHGPLVHVLLNAGISTYTTNALGQTAAMVAKGGVLLMASSGLN